MDLRLSSLLHSTPAPLARPPAYYPGLLHRAQRSGSTWTSQGRCRTTNHGYADSASVQCRRPNARYGTKGDADAYIRAFVRALPHIPATIRLTLGRVRLSQPGSCECPFESAGNEPSNDPQQGDYTSLHQDKKTRPAADYTPNLPLVQANCIANAGEPAAISLVQTMFANGISTTALTRRMTRDEAREYNYGAPSQMFRVFLREDKEQRSRCRLCAIGSDEGGWEHAKDALLHLKHDHFGLGTGCHRWSVLLSLYRMR